MTSPLTKIDTIKRAEELGWFNPRPSLSAIGWKRIWVEGEFTNTKGDPESREFFHQALDRDYQDAVKFLGTTGGEPQ